LLYHSPTGMGDVIEALNKLKFQNKKNILNKFFRANTSEPMFDFIWEQAEQHQPGFEKLKRAIMRAANETIEAGNEEAAFNEITKQIMNHFNMEHFEKTVDLKFKISEKGLNLFIYAYYLNDSKISYIDKGTYGRFDVEVFHDCFDNALNT
jgi:hypothetical protein